VLDHIQSHNSSDDGAEFFGGTVNMKYYVATGADDDSLDVDVGAQMNLQYAMLLPRSGRGEALMEIDSNGAEADTPRTELQVSNFSRSSQSAARTTNPRAAQLPSSAATRIRTSATAFCWHRPTNASA